LEPVTVIASRRAMCILPCMMLYLMRHGLAVEPGSPGFKTDADRALTHKGRRQLRKIAQAMAELELGFDLILSSPFVRARQTAEIVAGALKLKKQLKFSNALAVDGDPAILLRQLERMNPLPENLLLVGHEPGMSQLMSLLLTGNTRMKVDFKKSGLCKLEISKLKLGACATLVWMLTPGQLKLLK
jgi:phosphohistidine phosphatase